MGGLRGGPVLLLALVLLAAATAGCVAKKDETRDDVLRSWSRERPTDKTTDVTFAVPKDAERLKFTVSTKAPKEDSSGFDWGDWQDSCTYDPYCQSDSEPDEPSGYVTVNLWDANNAVQGRIELNHGSSDSLVILRPVPGTWLAKINYVSSYDGPVSLTASEPVQVAGGIGGSFWDIFGVVLAVGTMGGGWWLYRRRGRFLSREMHRIDATFSHRSDDIEECRANLREMKDHLGDLLVRRRIEEPQYLILEKRIDQYLADLDTPGNRHASPDASPDEGTKRGTALERIRRSDG